MFVEGSCVPARVAASVGWERRVCGGDGLEGDICEVRCGWNKGEGGTRAVEPIRAKEGGSVGVDGGMHDEKRL